MAMTSVVVSIENLAPEQGTFLTPLWFGFHDGGFDTYDRGRPVSPGLESLAEDGATDLISTEFDLAGFGDVQGTIPGPNGTPGVIDPGETATFTVELDSTDPTSRFFNYASMILPSNDFFIANGNERLHPIFDEDGNFIGADFIVLGNQVLDAGSEVNDEIPENTAFLGQQEPNTGTPENGVVDLGEGFIPNGNILGDERFVNADYTVDGYQVARIRVFLEPIPGETIRGTQGNDRLSGTPGDDEILGLRGNDRINGRGGSDRIDGGPGRNTLIGGDGSDTFVLSSGNGIDIIRDFTPGDFLELPRRVEFDDLDVVQRGRSTVISNDNDDLARLVGVEVADVTESTFV